MHASLKIVLGATHREDKSGCVCTKTELLIRIPWAFPGGKIWEPDIPNLATQVLGNSGFIYALCHPTVLFPALLLYFLNFSVTSASRFCFLTSPQSKAFTSLCTPHVPSITFDVTDSQRQLPAHGSWLPS